MVNYPNLLRQLRFAASHLHSRLPAQQIQHSHSHRQSICDLLQDRGMWTVRDIGRDFDTTVYRAGSQQEDVRFGKAEPFPVHAEQAGIFVDGRE